MLKDMANFLINNLFRLAVSTLNFASPSIVADVLLHPFDFATVLLQIGFDPEGVKCQTATLFSVIIQYALFTFYIPYLFKTMQGLQLMGMPHPSIFYYVGHIYKKEGVMGCYRGLLPKLCERIVMFGVNDRIKKKINKDYTRSSDAGNIENDNDSLFSTLINTVCSQFFAVLVSHPFHVLMVSSFAEFTCGKKSSMLELWKAIYADEGCFGFFTGLTARLLGELLSLIFSIIYTSAVNTQMIPQCTVLEGHSQTNVGATSQFVNYVTDISRFTAFKKIGNDGGTDLEDGNDNAEETNRVNPQEIQRPETNIFTFNLLRSLMQNIFRSSRTFFSNGHLRFSPIMAYIPLTSKLFYYIMVRDFLSKKISTPFFLVCHCEIILNSGWDKFPLLEYIDSLAILFQKHLVPGRTSSRRCKSKNTRK